MPRRISLRLDERALRQTRVVARLKNRSLSPSVTGLVVGSVGADSEYEAARQKALKALEKGLRLGGRPPSRERLHAR